LAHSFNDQLDQYGAWRHAFALRLRLLAEWMQENDLRDAAVQERLRRLECQMREDKVMVAFVAEFSRGKSEMINAIFFAGYGRRIMPASAGRTTMCPTEMAYASDVPPCLRLLPMDTRRQPLALMEWRKMPEKWVRIDLDVHNPQQLASAFEMVAQTARVTKEVAHALGFWNPQAIEDNPEPDAQGMVEIPKWRHALINIAHPLLKQGLVILDTPGLNASGAEPELTVSLIPQAQAVVFILGADTGVTKSDLSIWREHLVAENLGQDARLVVLNKIDTLWDELSTPEQIHAQIERQIEHTAQTLGIPAQRVLAVSAQKGLVAKVGRDAALLERSNLGALEAALGDGLLARRQAILGRAMHLGIAELRTEVGRVLYIRKCDLAEQKCELEGLRGKNSGVIGTMRSRIAQDQTDFQKAEGRIHAVRSVHLKRLKAIFVILGTPARKAEMARLTDALSQKGLKLGVRRLYGETFDRLRANVTQVQGLVSDIHAMLSASFQQLNAEYGFSLQALTVPPLDSFVQDLHQVESRYVHYLGVANAFQLMQAEFAQRLVRALSMRVQDVHALVVGALELWSKSALAQLDGQLRERRQHFVRRIEAIDRIQQAAGGLDERIAERVQEEHAVEALERKLVELTGFLAVANYDRMALEPALEPA